MRRPARCCGSRRVLRGSLLQPVLRGLLLHPLPAHCCTAPSHHCPPNPPHHCAGAGQDIMDSSGPKGTDASGNPILQARVADGLGVAPRSRRAGGRVSAHI